MVYGYRYTKDGLKKPAINDRWSTASGSLCSTTEDLLIWMKALHEGKIFSDKYYNLLTTPGTLNDGAQLRYAMGLGAPSILGHQVIGHAGRLSDFTAQTSYYPDDNLYLICLVNTRGPLAAASFNFQLGGRILDNKNTISQEIDFNHSTLEGRYTGQTRTGIYTLDVSVFSDGIILSSGPDIKRDTLRIYIGNRTWQKQAIKYIFTDDELRIDQVSGFYRYKKQ